MNKKLKKMIAPAVITTLFVAYLIIYVGLLLFTAEWNPVLLLPALPLIALGGGMLYVLRERIKEIEGGEEDDLGNY